MCRAVIVCFLQEESSREEEIRPPPVPHVAPEPAPEPAPVCDMPPPEIHQYMPEIEETPEPEPEVRLPKHSVNH